MEFSEAKSKFIAAWGVLGSNWGISRTMAQVHALLLISPAPLSTEDVMEQLSISRGNANLNLRALMDWKLVYKVILKGERKEYFSAEKDIQKVAMHITNERRKRELQPVLEIVETLKTLNCNSDEAKEMKKVIGDIEQFSLKADNFAQKLISMNESIFWSTLYKLIN
jgi:DNA-binding transcriptional regulator GbsR (MarR family)